MPGKYLSKPEPVQIVFKDLTYSVPVKDTSKKSGFFSKRPMAEKQILKGLTGVFQPGRVTAILGPSGSGKTSLINILAGATNRGKIGGDILVNGRKVTGSAIRLISGYVHQDDLILGTMTVKEAVMMSIKLRSPEMSEAERAGKLQEVLSLLQMEKAADTLIGTATMKGVSGGERKRAAIAMEMVTDPSILFLDEPTSGLDAYTAMMVVHILKLLAANGRTVITVMHQPSSEIFHMFDDLMIMTEGKITYFGEASKAVDYYASIGYQCPMYTNPADYIFMNVLFQIENDIAEKNRLTDVITSWESSPQAHELLKVAQQPIVNPITARMLKYRSGFKTQFQFLLKRAWHNVLRNKMIFKARLGQTIFFSLLIGLIYLQIPRKSQISAQIQDYSGSLFFIVVNGFFSTVMPLISVFSEERAVFQREHGSGYYTLKSYYFSKIIVELPINLFIPVIFSSITYWMIGYQADAGKFFIYMLTNVVMSLVGSAFGMFIASLFKQLQVALAVVPLVVLPLMMFGGFFLNNGSAPVYLGWIQWLSPIKYSFAALAKNQFRGLVIQGQDVGEQQLRSLSLDGGFSIFVNIVMMVMLYVVMSIFAFLSLYRLVNSGHGQKLQTRKELKSQLLGNNRVSDAKHTVVSM
ncbi:hypothetical protein K493DRAFT_280357 [Basidiobolus meristosporus CBS 931.73]|uniref:ABC transporter domain-containing protein n=1 Tax=Basidiobolus meristosporus CBS 931.73 TaxID=1314790 RepID=A0A1Y1YKP9_9FUNG|nr:hypothetical protein K493DRAFT_280357 [Basidiobolus meristosporus CBS 931.73]|eukprot:ORX98562.1 hypothetical protein K493DRAFT_280357 [Basidiobolus meristosporus CBS 931.73]